MISPYRFGYRMNRTMDLLNEHANRRIRPHRLRLPSARVLLWLVEQDRRSAGELANDISVDPSALSHLLARLTRNGLVRREREPHDARSVIVSLTPKGRRLAAALTPHFKIYDEVLVQDFSVAERTMLEGFLDRMYQNVLDFDVGVTETEDSPGRAKAATAKSGVDVG
ncbi:MAG: transcriptional regulator, MarR family [Hyphomicrobiales bacterium]|jgi:DNA-binding MarR family transcriptional regulator|nr:transcriptional regulator, MarR family [Hyphomicrobiales bacterium]